MPILKPKQGQSEQDYIEQCILDLERKGEGDSNDQRYAICKQTWKENMDLPIYNLIIDNEDNETGVDMVSLVDDPAMGYSYQLFKKEDKKVKFNVENADKRLVSGVLMLADTPIYRRDENGREYYVVFEKQTITDIMQKFFKNNYHLQANFNHMEDTKIDDGVYFYESFQIDHDRGIKSPAGYDLPDGTWFGTMKVENDDLWTYIKEGSFTGFSVEGIFEPTLKVAASKDEETSQIEEIIKELDSFVNEVNKK